MPSLFYGANNFYWSCGGEYKSYYDATLPSACAPYWDAFSELDQYTKDENIFWKENIDFVKSKFCFFVRKRHMFGFSDASASGCGADISLDSQHVCHKLWDSSEASKSSTW